MLTADSRFCQRKLQIHVINLSTSVSRKNPSTSSYYRHIVNLLQLCQDEDKGSNDSINVYCVCHSCFLERLQTSATGLEILCPFTTADDRLPEGKTINICSPCQVSRLDLLPRKGFHLSWCTAYSKYDDFNGTVLAAC